MAQLTSFLAIHSVFSIIVLVNLGVICGTLWHFRTVGVSAVLPYMVATLVLSPETKDGDRWEWFSRSFPLYPRMRQFLSMRIIVSENLMKAQKKKNAQFVMAMFPHGCNADFRVAMDGMIFGSLPDIAGKIRVLAASVLFRIPIVRETALWTGCVDARRQVAEKLLQQRGLSFLVFPGGQAEQLITEFGKETVFLKKRKGFVKLALKHNVPVVPIYVFGVSDYYRTSSWARQSRTRLVKSTGIAIPLVRGMLGSPICPFPVPTTIVCGDPIMFSVTKPGLPSQEEIEKAHMIFCKALVSLFEQHKGKLGYGDRTLDIQ